jgi:transposase
VINYEIKVGAFKGEDIASFLEISRRLINRQTSQAVVIMDNASIHHSVSVREYTSKSGMRIHFFPPYCPQLNPIEEYFGTLKSRYSQPRENITNSHDIKKTVERMISETSTELNFENYYQNMRRYLNKAFKVFGFNKI